MYIVYIDVLVRYITRAFKAMAQHFINPHCYAIYHFMLQFFFYCIRRHINKEIRNTLRLCFTLSAPKAIFRFLQTILIQVSQLVTSYLTWNQHCLPLSYQNSPNFYYMKNGDARFWTRESLISTIWRWKR